MTWDNKRYRSLSYFLKEKFGEKTMKISLDGGFSCPNRDGTLSYKGCIFCSEKGSGDFAGSRCKSITDQFTDIKEMMNKKWAKGKYIAYFQAFTNTYDTLDNLRIKYTEAINLPDVVGLAIATRPDCLDEEKVKLLSEISKKVFLFIELGLQTSNENTAKIINRGYENRVYEDSMALLRKYSIPSVTHVIFGLPSEKREDMIESVKYIVKNKSWGIKFHLLHLMKNTPLVNLYDEGKLTFLEREEYIDLICESIGLLSNDMCVHRLTGDSPRDLLIGPMWSLKKWEILNAIDKRLKDLNIWQGKNYED